MEFIIAILNGLKRTKAIYENLRNIAQKSRVAISSLMNPMVMIQILVSQVTATIIGYAKGLIVVVVVVILIIGLAVEGIKALSDSVMGLFTGNSKVVHANVSKWANGLSEEEIKKIMADGSFIHPKNLPDYIEIEQKTIPKPIFFNMKVRQVTSTPKPNESKQTKSWTEKYTLDLYDTAFPYRLWYQLLAGVDFIKGTAEKEGFKYRPIASKMANELAPFFEWKYNEHSKDVTDTVQYWEKKMVNGIVEYDKMDKEVETTKYYPLPNLHRVSTMFKNYIFKYKLDQVTLKTDFKTTVTSNTTTEQTTYSVSSYGQITESKKTVTIIKYRKEKTLVIEDVLVNVEEETDATRFINFLKSEKIPLADLNLLHEVATRLPQSGDFIAELTSVMEGQEGKFLAGGLSSGGGAYGSGLNLNPSVPTIKGKWTRKDLYNTAMSILDIPYFWGGKYSGLGANAEWGKLKTMNDTRSWAYGKQIPYGLDCSGYTSWVYNQALIPEGKRFITGSVNQWGATYMISEKDLRVGDIGFYKYGGGVHVGIYIGKIDGEQAFIHSGGRAWASPDRPAGRVIISLNNTKKYYKGNAPTKFKYFRRVPVEFVGD